jgi:hypothetical protein
MFYLDVDVVVYTCNPRTLEAEAGGIVIFEANLLYMRPFLKKTK